MVGYFGCFGGLVWFLGLDLVCFVFGLIFYFGIGCLDLCFGLCFRVKLSLFELV